jgi:uncharacterized metal-binding protein
MPSVPRPKAGIIACSGEELPEGTVTRLAALKVLQQLRPADTVTICLPLFLAGGEEDRTFARFHPTITVDGCPLRCAARGTERYSAPPRASVVVSEIAAAAGLGSMSGCRRLDAAGARAVELTAARLAALVDEVLGKPHAAGPAAATGPAEVEATCACGSGIPVRTLLIAGREVEVIALPPILSQLRAAARAADDALARELLGTVKISNAIPPEEEPAWSAALLAEYVTGEHWGHLTMGHGPELKFSAPPDAQGHAGVVTPEDAFVAAANTCVMRLHFRPASGSPPAVRRSRSSRPAPAGPSPRPRSTAWWRARPSPRSWSSRRSCSNRDAPPRGGGRLVEHDQVIRKLGRGAGLA